MISSGCADGSGVDEHHVLGRVLLDSNILIDVFNGRLDPRRVTVHGSVAISAVSVMEVYALAGMSGVEQHRIDGALGLLDVIPVTTEIARRAGFLARTRRRGKSDLLIAATALVHDLPLLTRNVRDFRDTPGLVLLRT